MVVHNMTVSSHDIGATMNAIRFSRWVAWSGCHSPNVHGTQKSKSTKMARSDLAVADGLRPHVGASNGTKLTVSIDQMCTSEAAMEAR